MLTLTTAALLLLGTPAIAQRPGGGGGGGRGMPTMPPLQLLTQDSIIKELKLADDQVKKLKEEGGKQMAARAGLRDKEGEERNQMMQELSKQADKIMNEVLKPDQLKRFKQIQLQQQGAQAFDNPEVAKELKITDDQLKQIKELRENARKEMMALGRPDPSNPEANKKRQEITKAVNEKVMAMMSADQKAKWKEMTGEPFTGEIRFTRPGGGS
jgi:restriction endonuclease S subunit